jgi:putative endonuclease
MWLAYALQSDVDHGFYIGMTSDLEQRLKDHNAGRNRSTKARRPFKLVYVEQCGTRIEARKRERYLKGGSGREFLKRHVLGSDRSAEAMSGGNSVVESLPSKQMVAGSNPVPRSRIWS